MVPATDRVMTDAAHVSGGMPESRNRRECLEKVERIEA
jgi:hypothetical protein